MAKQKTIACKTEFSGKALQTGKMTSVVCRPSEPDSGITFVRTDLPGRPRYALSDGIFTGELGRRTTVGRGTSGVQTVEHLLASLWALGIDNLVVEVTGAELPAMGGCAEGFFRALKEAGQSEQDADRRYIKITDTVRVGQGGRTITAMPGEGLTVSYLIDHKVRSVGREVFEIELDEASFEKEIAPARTFCMMKEALLLFLLGFGRGATLKNTLVLGNRGPLGTQLRFPNEALRHKVLDLVGDLYMLGKPVIGRIVAERSGHSLNAQLMSTLKGDGSPHHKVIQ